jgi:hypothetical protein
MDAVYRLYINLEDVPSEEYANAQEEKIRRLISSGKLDELLASAGLANATFHLEAGVKIYDDEPDVSNWVA